MSADGVGTRCSFAIDTHPGPTAPIRVLRVVGEIDLTTFPTLRTAMNAALFSAPDQSSHHLVIDLSGVTFCSVAGHVLLHDLADIAHTVEASYALAGLSPHLERIAQLVCGRDHLVRYRSVAGAVTALRALQAQSAEVSPYRTSEKVDSECRSGLPRFCVPRTAGVRLA